MADGGVRPDARHAARSPRIPLSVAQILELDAALIEAFKALHELRARYSAAMHIKFPPLPPVFSESIVIVAATKLFGQRWKARYGGPACDVLLYDASGETRSVEVKATGEHAFQELKAKDLRADYLIWVRFGRRFRDGFGKVTIAVLENPGRFITTPCRLDTARLERIPGVSDAIDVHVFASLDELMAGC